MKTILKHLLFIWIPIIPLGVSIYISSVETFGLLLFPLALAGAGTIYVVIIELTKSEEDKQLDKMFDELKIKPFNHR
jgi:uncharacterized membrane protein